jgi:hypothetical protein
MAVIFMGVLLLMRRDGIDPRLRIRALLCTP